MARQSDDYRGANSTALSEQALRHGPDLSPGPGGGSSDGQRLRTKYVHWFTGLSDKLSALDELVAEVIVESRLDDTPIGIRVRMIRWKRGIAY